MGGVDKAFQELAGVPLLQYALRPFLDVPGVRSVVVALGKEHAAAPPVWLQELDPRIQVVAGGATRSDSVRLALEALAEHGATIQVVVVHDGARPFVSREVVQRCVEQVRPGRGAVAGWPVVDTLKEVDSSRAVVGTPDRARYWRAQTPQAFPLIELLKAYRRAVGEDFEGTDDAAVFQWAGGRIQMVEGTAWNLKVTHPEDLRVARAFVDAKGAGTSP